MRKLFLFFVLFFLAGCIQQQKQSVPVVDSGVEVFFCPQDDCAGHLVEKIDLAEKTIDVAIYSFTLDRIADSLILAKKRGVTVRVLFDFLQASGRFSEDERLLENGIQVKLVKKSTGIMHHKFAVIDSRVVATGSFNYSQNADSFNNENILFLENIQIASEFEKEFEELWQQN